jgi:Cyclic nucleotide-binding domain
MRPTTPSSGSSARWRETAISWQALPFGAVRGDASGIDAPREADTAQAALRLVEVLSETLDCDGAPREDQVAILRAVADVVEEFGEPLRCGIVPFVPGRRPTFEASHPGLGASDCIAVLTGGASDGNKAIVLFELGHIDPRVEVQATLRLADRCGRDAGAPLRGWDRRPLQLDRSTQRPRRQLAILPEIDIPADELGFAHAFLRRVAVELAATWDGVPVAGDRHWLDVCDVRNLGSLYRRVLDRVVAPDTTRQAADARVADPGPDYHPWFPVLTIGVDKADLYTRALVSDIVGKETHLSDPAWLVRVGVYLELLTCLGIFAAVREDLGDLLSPDERRHVESSQTFADLLPRVDVDGWSKVWELRRIAFPRLGVPRAGPVSVTNLLHKKRATLAFLHVHHHDLKHAIELAGVNRHNAQETWQRVFRDAERAVLRKTAVSFPELAHLPGPMRDVVLWQQWGIGGQQGLYPTACAEYRSSMNMVAGWAKGRGTMDYTGEECVPIRVSLLDARMHHPERVRVLQRGDGYDDVADPASHDLEMLAARAEPSTGEFEALLANAPILQMLSPEELSELAAQARPLIAMPHERIIVQGADDDSLFIVADGEVEVLLRRDGKDTLVDTMGRGSVFGEMSLLTGERRTATVRALDTAVVFEIGAQKYRPIIQAHPEWLDELAEEMADRLRRREQLLNEHDRTTTGRIRDRIRDRFFGSAA